MSGRIPPVGPATPVPGAVPDRREGGRRQDERRQADRRASGRALVPRESPAGGPDETAGTAAAAAAGPPVPPIGTGAFEAQLLGQTGARKGLRGGPPVLDAARSAYLGNEYTGEKDRRPLPGKTGKTEI